MTSRDFCYWLQGHFELSTPPTAAGAEPVSVSLNPQQVDLIKRHLHMVFIHEIDPSAGPPAHQAELDAAHKPASAPPGHLPGNPTFRC